MTATEKAAQSALLTLLSRAVTLLLIPISLYFGARFVSELDALSRAIGTLSANQAVMQERISQQGREAVARGVRIASLETGGSDFRVQLSRISALLQSIDQRLARQEARADRQSSSGGAVR